MRLRLLVAVVVVAAVVWLYASGTHQEVDPDRIRRWLRGTGAWGGLLFVGVYSLLQPLGVRSIFFLLSAPLVWSPAQAVLLGWLGTMGACILAFGIGRFVVRDWAQARLPQRARRFDDRLSARGFQTVLFLRLVFFTTPALQYALGVSRVRFGAFIAGTAAGIVPFTLLATFLSARVSAWLGVMP